MSIDQVGQFANAVADRLESNEDFLDRLDGEQ